MSDPDQTRRPDDAPETLGEAPSTPIEPTEPALDSLQTRFNADDSIATRAPSDTPCQWNSPLEGFPGYELLETLGEGGMGTVYKARQEGLNRLVALKVILGGRRAGPKDLIRFLAEAEAVASIKHPHVVQVHEYGEVDGRPFLTLEYLPGGTLADKLKREKHLEPKVAAKLVAKLARAVQDAHDQGIVHRDLKPANVLFDAEGEPKVTDFGLAKRAKGTDLTQTQAIMGTPAYMSPEQAKGNTKFVGPAADIYALGVILYECLAGIRPFQDDDTHVLLRKVIEDEPLKPSKHIPGLPRDLELIALKCLAKDPADRYTTAKALAEDLAHFTAGEPVSVRAVGTIERTLKWARRKPTLAAAYLLATLATLLVGLGGAAVWQWRVAVGERGSAVSARDAKEKARAEAEQQRMKAEAAQIKEAEARAEAERQREKFERFEYGRTMQVAHQEWREDNIAASLALLDSTREDLRGWEWRYLHRLWNSEILTLKGHTNYVNSASFSSDGSRIVTASWDKTAKVWDARTGAEILTLKGHTDCVRSASFSPDGLRIVTASKDKTAKVWDAKSGAEILTLKWHTDGVTSASFSPDGSRIVTASDDQTVKVWDAKSGAEITTLKGHSSRVNSAAFSPDGSRIVTASWDKTAKVWDAKSGAEVLTLKGHTSFVTSASFSPDASRIVTASLDQTAKVWDAKSGAEVLTLKGHSSRVTSAMFSPDGSRIVTASEDETAKVWDTRSMAERLAAEK